MQKSLKRHLKKHINSQRSNFDLITYNLEFENADYILNKIEKLNEKAEQLKVIYVSKHHLGDFTGEEIRKVETLEDYEKLKDTINNITSIIIDVKLIQDLAINKINLENNINKKVQSNVEKKNAMNIYKSNAEKK
ncbi:MAG: hypothetical protein K0R09_1520 [Clostridiales bacterium]|nr:hypothetical protein [Clostridiales bacterium]